MSWSFNNNIRVNQVGYYPQAPKYFILATEAASEFKILNFQTGVEVQTGDLSAPRYYGDSEEYIRIGDFSSLTAPGVYQIEIADVGVSLPFIINEDAYRDILIAAMRSFYYQRASTDIPESFGGIYARATGHADAPVPFHEDLGKPAGAEWSSPGGWYDAGDYGKYVVNAGVSMGIMSQLYTLFPDLFQDNSLNIPESGSGRSDLLDELKYELDWLLTMQDSDGGVFFKLTPKNFEGHVMPANDASVRYLIGKSTTSSLDFAAMLAQAARIWQPLDPVLATQYLDAAIAAFEWAVANPSVRYTQGSGSTLFADVNTGGYGDANFADEFFWARSELYLATEDVQYKPASVPDAAGLGWANVQNLGIYDLAMHADFDATLQQSARTKLIALADNLKNEINSSPFRLHNENFSWGSNGNVASQSVALVHAWVLTGDDSYIEACTDLADYLLGRNGLNISFVTGFGHVYPMVPHHRIMDADRIEEPIPGFVVGGPNKNFNSADDDLKVVITAGAPPAKSYVDKLGSYASNEVAINWNSPLVFLLGALQHAYGNTKEVLYEQGPFHVFILSSEGGSVTIEPEAPPQGYAAGTEVTVTAVPGAGREFFGWSGSLKGSEASIQFVIEKNMSLKAYFDSEDENLVRNGDFSDSLRYWSVGGYDFRNTYGIGAAVWDEGEFRIDVQFEGQQEGQVFGIQNGIRLRQGENYVLNFKARADIAEGDPLKEMIVVVKKGALVYYTQRVVIAADQNEYIIPFTMNFASDPYASLEFQVGRTKPDVWLDDVSLSWIDGPLNVESPRLFSTGVRLEVLKGGVLNILSESSFTGSLRMYDIKGNLNGVVHQGFFRAGDTRYFLPQAKPGIYFLQLETPNHSITSRHILLN
jgi:endoglucanase